MRMSRRDWRRLDVVERIERGQLTIAEGARSLDLSDRQMQRVRRRVEEEGQAGVTHGNAGRASKHKIAQRVRERVVAFRKGLYRGFNDQHFTEKLLDVEELAISRSTVRRILRSNGVGAERGRRPPKHRRRRDRRPQAGQMILWDGSRHPWLEDRGPRLCLIAAIDDATGELLPGGHFVEQECTVGYLRVLCEIVKTTQAKGRVERLWGTLQDRLVSELRLVGARTAVEANRVLEKYRPAHNARFAVPAQDAHQAWRPCPDRDTAEALCALQYVRVVANNNTVRISKQIIDIPRRPGGRSTYAKTLVTVRHRLDGRYLVYFGGEVIARAKGAAPTAPRHEPMTMSAKTARLEKAAKKRFEKRRNH